MGAKQSLEDDLITFKLTSKQMVRSSKKCEKSEQMNKEKLKAAIAKGDRESNFTFLHKCPLVIWLNTIVTYLLHYISAAKIYAENAIREKNQALSFIRMSSRVDAVAARLETAIRMQQVSAAMGQTVKGMSNVMKSMDVRF